MLFPRLLSKPTPCPHSITLPSQMLLSSAQTSLLSNFESELSRIAALTARLNAFVHLDTDAPALPPNPPQGESHKRPLGPLHGILSRSKVALKSLIGLLPWLSPLKETLRPCRSSNVRACGAILLGSTNTPEFLMAYENRQSRLGRKSAIRGTPLTPPAAQAAAKQRPSPRAVPAASAGWRRLHPCPCAFLRNLRTQAHARLRPATGHIPPGNSSSAGSASSLPAPLRTFVFFLMFWPARFSDPFSVARQFKKLRTQNCAMFALAFPIPPQSALNSRISRRGRRAAHLLEQAGFRVEPFNFIARPRSICGIFRNRNRPAIRIASGRKRIAASPIFLTTCKPRMRKLSHHAGFVAKRGTRF